MLHFPHSDSLVPVRPSRPGGRSDSWIGEIENYSWEWSVEYVGSAGEHRDFDRKD